MTLAVGHVHAHAPHELTERPRALAARPLRAPARARRRAPARAHDAGHRVVRLPGGALVRRAVPALRARVGHPHQGRSRRPHAGGAAADRRPPVLQRLAGRPRGRRTRGWRRSTGAASARSSCPRSARGSRSSRSPTRGRVPGPLYLPEYRSADLARSAKLDAAADALYKEGTEAKSNDDRYILVDGLLRRGAVLRRHLAAPGLATAAGRGRSAWRSLLLVGGVAFVLTLPVA